MSVKLHDSWYYNGFQGRSATVLYTEKLFVTAVAADLYNLIDSFFGWMAYM